MGPCPKRMYEWLADEQPVEREGDFGTLTRAFCRRVMYTRREIQNCRTTCSSNGGKLQLAANYHSHGVRQSVENPLVAPPPDLRACRDICTGFSFLFLISFYVCHPSTSLPCATHRATKPVSRLIRMSAGWLGASVNSIFQLSIFQFFNFRYDSSFRTRGRRRESGLGPLCLSLYLVHSLNVSCFVDVTPFGSSSRDPASEQKLKGGGAARAGRRLHCLPRS